MDISLSDPLTVYSYIIELPLHDTPSSGLELTSTQLLHLKATTFKINPTMASQSSTSHGPMRAALILESLANIFGAGAMMLYPEPILNYLSTPASSYLSSLKLDSPSVAAILLQWLAAIILGLTVPLLLCIPQVPRAIQSRYIVYVTLLAGEVALGGTILYQALYNGGKTGLTSTALFTCAGSILAFIPWRLFVLFGRPQWVGMARTEKKIQ